ncbi:MAG: type I-U CRISPR-associated protein Cas7 [Firmicutes bacterium]|nr:type I-U CRISPR-associated protein Cas7 [Bacillota bacterium]
MTTTAKDLWGLGGTRRLYLEAPLRPVSGELIQPTGFPSIGAAHFRKPGSHVTMLIVESEQSMANRLEGVCWDSAAQRPVADLEGMPYVHVDVQVARGETRPTSSLTEAHRLHSAYIVDAQGTFMKDFAEEAGIADDSPVDMQRLARTVFKYDPNSLVHGVFFANLNGRARLTRALYAMILGEDAEPVHYGGVKVDHIQSSRGAAGRDAEAGYGNIPYARTLWTCGRIRASFTLDLDLLQSYGLPEEALRFLVALSLWKIRRLLDGGMRLRTLCDLETDDDSGGIAARRPQGWPLPPLPDLTAALRESLEACRRAGLFADPPVTRLMWTEARAGATRRTKEQVAASQEEGGFVADR